MGASQRGHRSSAQAEGVGRANDRNIETWHLMVALSPTCQRSLISIILDQKSVHVNAIPMSITLKAFQDLLDELGASKQSRLRAWRVLQRLRMVLSEVSDSGGRILRACRFLHLRMSEPGYPGGSVKPFRYHVDFLLLLVAIRAGNVIIQTSRNNWSAMYA
jgi:hypothetical protein